MNPVAIQRELTKGKEAEGRRVGHLLALHHLVLWMSRGRYNNEGR